MSAVVFEPLPVLRPMRQQDLPAVLEVERAAYDHPWSENIFQDCLRVGYYCVVCDFDGRIVGHGIMSLGVGECHLLNICIHPDYQRRRLGNQLVNYLLDLARWKKIRMSFSATVRAEPGSGSRASRASLSKVREPASRALRPSWVRDSPRRYIRPPIAPQSSRTAAAQPTSTG